MRRDKTIALFLECEARRREALAENIGHKAATAHWNAWAEGLLVERKAMEANGRWAAEKRPSGSLEPKNEETRSWIEKASADFSRCRFVVRGVEGTKEEGNEDGALPVKSIQLEGDSADFSGFIFPDRADFCSATFMGRAGFCKAIFTGETLFIGTTFFGKAQFNHVTFYSGARFDGATFKRDFFCQHAKFRSAASFVLCDFQRHATFANSRFDAEAKFTAIRGDRGFNMADVVFEVVPDFIQAHFEEAPRLDNLVVGRMLPTLKEIADKEREKLTRAGRWHRRRLEKNRYYRRVFESIDKDSGLRNMPARWRALKRLAIQGHDTERELEFHARETQSLRFSEDWPVPLRLFKDKYWLPIVFWRTKAWAGFFRFLFGCLYAFFSDYGRSLARPLIASLLVLIAAGAFYLSQTEAMQARLGLREASYVSGTVQTALHAFAAPAPCYMPPPALAERWRKHWPWLHRNVNTPASRIDGLVEPFRSQTNARAEALHLAARNAFVVLDGLGEAAHRSFGCLYGVELYGGSTPMAIVPGVVSTVSAAQKLFSAVMIFLFGLALRNMLKMK